MGGQSGLRGYLVQTIIALLESLKDNDWESVTIEPNEVSEKVDILWEYPEGRKKAVQVKSSIIPFKRSDVKKWITELKTNVLTTEIEMHLVGKMSNSLQTAILKGLDDATVKNIPLELDLINSLISEKIDAFFHLRNKPKINYDIRNLIASNLKISLLGKSILGHTLTRDELNENLINTLRQVEVYVKNNVYGHLIGVTPQSQQEEQRLVITEHIMNLLGWNNFNLQEKVTLKRPKSEKEEQFVLDFNALCESRLKDKEKDFICINSSFNASYGTTSSEQIIAKNKVIIKNVSDVILSRKISNISSEDRVSKHHLQVLLSADQEEQKTSLIENVKSQFSNLPLADFTYYLLDNKQAAFLISSIISAKEYKSDIALKFLYPITDENLSEQKIGKRGLALPPQFINTSILPIVKEDSKTISILIYCNDKYSKEALRKVIWLTIALTSGFANEYRIYFPEFDIVASMNDIKDTIRSFNDELLLDRTTVHCIDNIEPEKLNFKLPDQNKLQSLEVDETNLKGYKITINNTYLVDYLPYGSILKPFLSSEQITSEDLKSFLAAKGIFLKSANREKIIHLMTGMLFSPLDIDLLSRYVIEKDKQDRIIPKYNPHLVDTNYQPVIDNMTFDKGQLEKDTKAKITNIEIIKGVDGSRVIQVDFVEKNPNKQAMISEVAGKAVLRINNTAESGLDMDRYHSTQSSRTITGRLLKLVEKELIAKGNLSKEVGYLKFSDFTNSERIDFLLSFTNLNYHTIFKQQRLRMFNYCLDETMTIPTELSDRVGKEVRTLTQGKDLSGIKEMTDTKAREYLMVDKIAVSYEFEYIGSKGELLVEINFSNALTPPIDKDAIIDYKPKILLTTNEKSKINNLKKFEEAILAEFSNFRKSKIPNI